MRNVKKNNNLIAAKYLAWVPFVTKGNLVNVTLSQTTFSTTSEILVAYLIEAKSDNNKFFLTQVYVPRVKHWLLLGNLCLFYMLSDYKT